MEYSINSDGGTCTISLSGKFGFEDSSEFRKLIGGLAEQKGNNVIVDLDGLQSIDSAGLGMIILLNDAATDNSINLQISGAKGQVRKMLDISNFSELMMIE